MNRGHFLNHIFKNDDPNDFLSWNFIGALRSGTDVTCAKLSSLRETRQKIGPSKKKKNVRGSRLCTRLVWLVGRGLIGGHPALLWRIWTVYRIFAEPNS